MTLFCLMLFIALITLRLWFICVRALCLFLGTRPPVTNARGWPVTASTVPVLLTPTHTPGT